MTARMTRMVLTGAALAVLLWVAAIPIWRDRAVDETGFPHGPLLPDALVPALPDADVDGLPLPRSDLDLTC